MAPQGTQPLFNDNMLTTVLWRQKQTIDYAYECSVECGAGTLNWAKRMGLFSSYRELNKCPIGSIENKVRFMPSFG